MNYKNIANEIIFGGGRAAGRTYAAADYALKNNGKLVVATRAQANRIKAKFPDLEVVTFAEIESLQLRGSGSILIIDHYAFEVLWRALENEIKTRKKK